MLVPSTGDQPDVVRDRSPAARSDVARARRAGELHAHDGLDVRLLRPQRVLHSGAGGFPLGRDRDSGGVHTYATSTVAVTLPYISRHMYVFCFFPGFLAYTLYLAGFVSPGIVGVQTGFYIVVDFAV